MALKTNLTKPCNNCPFRTDIEPFLTRGRVEEIGEVIVEQDGHFTCHKTLDKSDQQMCAGSMIMLEHMEQPNQIMRIWERLGSYDHTKMDMTAPVYKCLEDMIDRHPPERYR